MRIKVNYLINLIKFNYLHQYMQSQYKSIIPLYIIYDLMS